MSVTELSFCRCFLFRDLSECDCQSAKIGIEYADESGDRRVESAEDLGDEYFFRRELRKLFNSGCIDDAAVNETRLNFEFLMIFRKFAQDLGRFHRVFRSERYCCRSDKILC